MAVTNYYTVNGKIRGEGTAAGGFRPYGHDALGSVVATYDSTGSLENAYRNAPYGTQVAKTGTAADPRFLYNGGSGYRTTGRNYSPYYARKRHLDNKTAQWTTIDPLWPNESAYSYVWSSPVSGADPSGNALVLEISYLVWGFGWHRGIVVVDNMGHGGIPYSFAGGPANFNWVSYFGPLIDRSSPWLPSPRHFFYQDYYFYHDRLRNDPGKVRVISLVNDTSSYKYWMTKLGLVTRFIDAQPPQDYAPLPSDSNIFGGGTANSNTWNKFLLKWAGLLPAYNNAIQKLPGNDLPWAPGFNIECPYNSLQSDEQA